ncbi:MAG: signal peptidase I [Clostridiaceae bacterium]|nr:signal peptidase I [Clostridiaceae bacterium]
MKKLAILSKILNIILYIVVAFVLTAAIGSAIFNKPIFLSAVRSNSMYPLFQRGDMILIKSISDKDALNIGDIVVFKDKEGSLSSKGWIVHRIIEGNDITGYITKGDANDYTDQATGEMGPVKRDWIVSRVVTIKNKPVKIPLIGYLPLWMEKFQTTPYAMPIIAVLLAVIIAISELTVNRRKHNTQKKSGLTIHLFYFLGGITMSIIMSATMLATSQRIVIPYEVSENSQGILMGSDIGIIRVGDKIQKPLSELSNNGFFPVIAVITTSNDDFSFSHPLTTLAPGETIKTEFQLIASEPGNFNETIYIGMFYPLLPPKLIYGLAARSYWLALIIVSLIPGLPLMSYPLIDSKLRKKFIKEVRRLHRRILRYIPIFN